MCNDVMHAVVLLARLAPLYVSCTYSYIVRHMTKNFGRYNHITEVNVHVWSCLYMLCVQLLNIEALVKIFSNLKLVTGKLPYSGKLLREKTFANFAVLWQYTKIFSAKFGTWHSLAKANNPQKFSPRKSYFSPICESFLPRKFPAIR